MTVAEVIKSLQSVDPNTQVNVIVVAPHVSGVSGPAGPQGPMGPAGPMGFPGPQGPAGLDTKQD